MQPTPEQLVGLPVLGAGGDALGTVEDVGLAAWNQPKFLLVRLRGDGTRLVRVDFREVAGVDVAVRLAPPGPPTRLA